MKYSAINPGYTWMGDHQDYIVIAIPEIPPFPKSRNSGIFQAKVPEIHDFHFLHYLLQVACFALLVNSVTCVSCVVVRVVCSAVNNSASFNWCTVYYDLCILMLYTACYAGAALHIIRALSPLSLLMSRLM
jgi:hypothetical protein